MLETLLNYSNVTSATPSVQGQTEHVAYSSIALSFYILSGFLSVFLYALSCIVIRRKKQGRIPKYSGIYISLGVFCGMRTIAFSLRVALTQYPSNIGLFAAHTIMFQAGLPVLVVYTQEVALSWVDNSLKRTKAFSPKLVKAIKIITALSKILLTTYVLIGIGSMVFFIQDFSLMANPTKSPGLTALRSISNYGNLSFVILQTLIVAGLYIYMLIYMLYAKFKKQSTEVALPEAQVQAISEVSLETTSSISEDNTPPSSTQSILAPTALEPAPKVKPVQMTIILGTPWMLFIMSIPLLAKVVYTLTTLYVNQNGLSYAWYYVFGVYSELGIIFSLLLSAPSALYKLKPFPKQKQPKAKEPEVKVVQLQESTSPEGEVVLSSV